MASCLSRGHLALLLFAGTAADSLGARRHAARSDTAQQVRLPLRLLAERLRQRRARGYVFAASETGSARALSCFLSNRRHLPPPSAAAPEEVRNSLPPAGCLPAMSSDWRRVAQRAPVGSFELVLRAQVHWLQACAHTLVAGRQNRRVSESAKQSVCSQPVATVGGKLARRLSAAPNPQCNKCSQHSA